MLKQQLIVAGIMSLSLAASAASYWTVTPAYTGSAGSQQNNNGNNGSESGGGNGNGSNPNPSPSENPQAPPAVLTFSAGSLPVGTRDAPYSFDFKSLVSVSGGTGGMADVVFSLTSGTLPPGLSLSPGGVLSGTPTIAATSLTISVTATYQGATSQQLYTLNIAHPTPQITMGAGALPDGTKGASYTFDFRPLASVSGGSGGIGDAVFSVASGTIPAGLTLASNGLLSGTPSEATTGQSFGILGSYQGANSQQTYTIKIGNPAAQITLATGALPAGTQGSPYTFDFKSLASVTGGSGGIGDASFSVVGGNLPAGITLAANGVLSGTPSSATAPSGQALTILASYQGATKQQTYTLKIDSPPAQITINTGVLPDATVGQPYSFDFKSLVSIAGGTGGISDATFSVASGSIPTGLSLNSSGLLAGTPSIATPAIGQTFNIKASYQGASSQQAYNVKVNNPPAQITMNTGTLPDGFKGEPYSFDFKSLTSVSGGSGNIANATFTLPSGSSLPSGLVLGVDGVLSGTPTIVTPTVGQSFNVAAGYEGASGQKNYIIKVSDIKNVTLTGCHGNGILTLENKVVCAELYSPDGSNLRKFDENFDRGVQQKNSALPVFKTTCFPLSSYNKPPNYASVFPRIIISPDGSQYMAGNNGSCTGQIIKFDKNGNYLSTVRVDFSSQQIPNQGMSSGSFEIDFSRNLVYAALPKGSTNQPEFRVFNLSTGVLVKTIPATKFFGKIPTSTYGGFVVDRATNDIAWISYESINGVAKNVLYRMNPITEITERKVLDFIAVKGGGGLVSGTHSVIRGNMFITFSVAPNEPYQSLRKINLDTGNVEFLGRMTSNPDSATASMTHLYIGTSAVYSHYFKKLIYLN